MRSLRSRRRSEVFAWAGAALATAASFSPGWAVAGPHVVVRGAGRFEAQAAPSKGTLAVWGALRDDADHPIGHATVTLELVAADGTHLDARGCDPESPPLALQPDRTWEVATHADGTFCARADPRPGTTTVSLSWPGEPLIEGARARLEVDGTRRPVSLAFDPEPRVILLGDAPTVFRAVAKVSGDDGPAAPGGLALRLTDERGAALGGATTDSAGRATFVVPARAMAPPGPGTLRLEFDGDPLNARSSRGVACERHVQVLVAAHALDPATGVVRATEEEGGAGVELDVKTAAGDAVPGGSVEALIDGAVVGVAPVGQGRSSLVLRGVRGAVAHVDARYVPDLPWYVAAPPTVLTLEIRGASPWRRVAVVAAGLLIIAWFVASRVRALAMRAEPPPSRDLGGTRDAARVEVVALHEDGRATWEGRVVDGHDGGVVPGATVSVERPTFAGVEVLATTSSDEAGRFVLPASDVQPGDRLAAHGPLHARAVLEAPPRGVIEVALVSRRRALLRRLVQWARARGAPFDVRPEPTPAQVRRAAGPGSKAAAWAAAVESAAFGDREVDADLEAEVERLGHETPDPGAPGAPSR